jgi:hypothetical protein
MMKTAAAIAAFVAGANALVARDATCCFGLTASGGASGTIGQLGDGQNRIGGGLPPAQFCIDSSGGIKDSSGRGCILTRKSMLQTPNIKKSRLRVRSPYHPVPV